MGAISGEEAIAIANQYTEESLAGAGAVAGVPCQIQSITDITGGHRVTFLWVDNNGDSHTSSMDVLNGVNGQDGRDGADGKGIKAVTINEEDHLIITYSDDTTSDAGKIEIQSAVDSVNGKTGAVTLDASDVGALPDDTAIPTKTSNLTNDSGFITKAVNDLINYYLKSETYSKTEVDNIITAVKNSRFEVVATLPTTDIKTNVIYLVPKSPSQTSNVKDEYINLDGTTTGWEKIGDTEIDLSGYVTTEALNTALADYTTTADLTTMLAGKQDTLTFDNAPTENSNNPVKSGGVYSANQTIYEVMGQNGAKNLLPNNIYGTTTNNGITVVRNDDGSLNISGTNTSENVISISLSDAVWGSNTKGEPWLIDDYFDRTQTYIMSISETDVNVRMRMTFFDSSQVAISGSSIETRRTSINITIPSEAVYVIVRLAFSSGTTVPTDTVVYPMLRLASDTDSTYQPYAKTNQELTAENEALSNRVNDIVNVYGSKNLLPFNLADIIARNTRGTWSGNNYTRNGITYTINDDGSITANGTSTENAQLELGNANDFLVDGTEYIASYGDWTYNANQYMYINGVGRINSPSGLKFTFDSSAHATGSIYIRIVSGETVSNLTFYPMLRLASITDDTYEPYAKTNQQLTEDTTALLDNLEVNGAVNMCKNNAATQTTTDGTTTFTWTVNDDGTVTVSAPSYPVTLASNIYVELWKNITADECKELVEKTLKCTGCPSGGGSNKYRISLYRVGTTDGSTGTNATVEDDGDGVVFTWKNNGSGTKATIYLELRPNYEMTGPLTFKPMITVPSYNGDYVPYAKSNKELTDDVESLDAMYDGKAPSAVSDLNVPLTAGGATVAFTRHLNNTTNAPTNGGGLEITWSSSDKYGAQLTLTDGGLYFRTNNNGTISAWQKIST